MKRSEHITATMAELMGLVLWLRSLPNAHKAACAESTLYFLPGHNRFMLGYNYQDGGAVPRPIASGKAQAIFSLPGLPPRKVARFIKRHRIDLARLSWATAAKDKELAESIASSLSKKAASFVRATLQRRA